MIVAGAGLSLMNAMISTEQDISGPWRGLIHGEEHSPIIIKSTEFFPVCGQSGRVNEEARDVGCGGRTR